MAALDIALAAPECVAAFTSDCVTPIVL